VSGAVQPEPDVQTRERATTLLRTFAGGDAHAADELTPMLYDQLRALAGSVMAQERASHTLQPTALVHEAYVRLIDQRTLDPGDRGAFLGLAATVMRRILVDHARARGRVKRGGGFRRVEIGEGDLRAPDAPGLLPEDIEAMDRALTELAELDARKARLVELRFFAGLDESGAAEVLGISRATASREWRMARAWLAQRLDEGRGASDG